MIADSDLLVLVFERKEKREKKKGEGETARYFTSLICFSFDGSNMRVSKVLENKLV